MEIEVFVVSAFGMNESGGNPAGIVLDAQGLSDSQMLQIAAEVGLSETAFLSPSDSCDFRLRFFTPVSEVGLCGHATIATYSLL
ncbi:MAG: PhzF family phenazine biosynthesis protein, partial [Bdellovibrionales bacterium]|nr:PhzF family phenazine biosynthesis protein [Bdellovibrionales bacterium]